MELTYVLLRRAAAISLACLLCVLLLAVWRARSDVRREGLGAGQLAQLSSQLAALQNVAESGLQEKIGALREVGHLRHLDFRLEDAGSGEVLAQSKAEELPPLAMRPFLWLLNLFARPHAAEESSWHLERADGRSFRVTLTTNPFSEQREAFDDIVGVTGVLLLYSLCLLVALYWAVRHAFAPLRRILDTIGAFERQDYRARLPAMRIREMDVIARALNHLAAALGQIQEERRLLSLKLLTLQEDERSHIARELHDELGQSLTAMRADATYLLRRTDQQPELHAVVAELEQQCARVQQDIRDLLGWLGKPSDATNRGPIPIDELVEALVESWRNRPGQTIEYRLTVDLGDIDIPQALALTLYRMTQEALTNVARHADAKTAAVRLVTRPGQAIEWSVCDDGVGIASYNEASQQGNGLAGIRERVWAHGGELEMLDRGPTGSAPGLRLVACFPCPEAERASGAPSMRNDELEAN
ncbi:signal transduction histidine kinase, glucose-6-phosphate specific [Azoarcus sp. CIB]|uniref:sensor histidine kinase n=1 Tax=Aromatoleum sp. (strain CIB) TaxID=198107 RepID=UPI00067AE357|nr:histidine kinase [Azoarcus sp. CIB]AKU11562.1 signal transduction histidine kinase, glucose-6-phosphate specific [Azoarcus sp. CIB]